MFERAGGRASRIALLSVFLLVVNVAVAWRLFKAGFLIHMGSAEGFYVALARYISAHWDVIWGWWPLWYAGMPFQNTYQPVLHLLSALLATGAPLQPVRAFHIVVAVFYVLGPVTLFWMVTAISGSLASGFLSALLYSLWSPSALLVRDIRADVGSLGGAKRLLDVVGYGDGPHVSSLTLVCVAILAVHWALRKPEALRVALASAAVVAVPLTNIPGTIGLAFCLFAYVGVYVLGPGNANRLRNLSCLAAIALLGYGLGAHWLPPSTLTLMRRNTELLRPENAFTPKHFWYLALFLGGSLLLVLLFARLRIPKSLGFFVLSVWPFAMLVLGLYWLRVTLLAQPNRFHVELEMMLIPALVLLCRQLLRSHVRLRKAALVVVACLLVFQFFQYRLHARKIIQTIDVSQTSEYKIAHWAAANLPAEERVSVAGSIAFWFNAFADQPQLTGCCEQGRLTAPFVIGEYELSSDAAAGGQAGEISKEWLECMGASVVAATGPRSTERYHFYSHADKFRGVLQELWRDGDDAIFRLPVRFARLAHVVPRASLISRLPVNGVDMEPLAPFARALETEGPAVREARWRDFRSFHISADILAGSAVAVRIAWHPGWRATANGIPIPVQRDALNLITLDPPAAPHTDIDLVFDGGREMKAMNAINIAAVLIFVGLISMGAIRRPRPEIEV